MDTCVSEEHSTSIHMIKKSLTLNIRTLWFPKSMATLTYWSIRHNIPQDFKSLSSLILWNLKSLLDSILCLRQCHPPPLSLLHQHTVKDLPVDPPHSSTLLSLCLPIKCIYIYLCMPHVTYISTTFIWSLSEIKCLKLHNYWESDPCSRDTRDWECPQE
jgi:hypothetical protein